ncbi:MAG: hypothetical protein WCD18_14845 [Thermosynechococcaceae cyanobacterium]
MISNAPPRRVPMLRAFKLQGIQSTLQDWINREIISEDPYDHELIVEQALYEQLKQLEFESIKVPLQPSEKLDLSSSCARTVKI